MVLRQEQPKNGDSGRKVDDEGWERVNRRRKPNNQRHFSEDPRLTSFFVSNIPISCSNNKLWCLFERFGDLKDSYVCKKMDKSKSYFGFIKFQGVKDPYAMESLLDQSVKWEGAVLGVNLARFDRRHQPINYGPTNTKRCPSNSKPVTHKASHHQQQGAFQPVHVGFSYKDACTGASGSKIIPKVIHAMDKSDLFIKHCFGRSVLCQSRSVHDLEESVRFVKNVGFTDYEIIYIGGLHCLILFKDHKTADSFLAAGEELWGKIFTSVSIWKGVSPPFERITSVRIWGVPVHLRDSALYESIARPFCVKVLRSDFSWGSNNNSFGSCLILCNSGSKVNEEITLSWADKKCKVWITEDSQDWRPCFTTCGDPGRSDNAAGVQDAMAEDEESNNSSGQLQGVPSLTPAFQVGLSGTSKSRKRPRFTRSPIHSTSTAAPCNPNFLAHTPSSSFPDLNNNPCPPSLSSDRHPGDAPASIAVMPPVTNQVSTTCQHTPCLDPQSGIPQGDVVLDPSNYIEQEVQSTMEVGLAVGFQLHGFEEQIRAAVTGEGETLNA